MTPSNHADKSDKSNGLLKDKEAVAAHIATVLGGALGEANPRDPATWIVVAAKQGCLVSPYFLPNGPRGYYTPSKADGRCLIEYNTAHPEETQARAILRGLSQHITHGMVPLTCLAPINLDNGKRDPAWRPSPNNETEK